MTTKNCKDVHSSAIAQSYKPTEREQESITAHLDRRQARKPAPRMKVVNHDGMLQFKAEHPAPALGHYLLMEAFGTAEPDFLNGLLGQVAGAVTKGQTLDESGLDFMLAVVKGVEPKDQLEAMLAAQMAAVHNATMTFARRLSCVEKIQQQDSAERAFNKLSRTFAVQLEALKRYRTGGEQRVTVEHVTVNEGGKAIVGNVTHGKDGGGTY